MADYCPQSVDFVVPDHLLASSEDVLSALCRDADELFSPCVDPDTCSTVSPYRATPAPSLHIHLTQDADISVGLYAQRETLWFLPPLDSSSLLVPPGTDASAEVLPSLPAPFVWATDATVLPPSRPERSSGVFQVVPGRHPIVGIRAHVLLEAFLRIYARDVGTMAGSFGASMVAYMSLYVDADGYLDRKRVPPPLLALYETFDSAPLRQWTAELKEVVFSLDENTNVDSGV